MRHIRCARGSAFFLHALIIIVSLINVLILETPKGKLKPAATDVAYIVDWIREC